MAIHRIRLADLPPPNSQSFSHQQSICLQPQSKHKKKTSLYHRNDRTPIFTRIKTDEKQQSLLQRQQPINHGLSVHLGHSGHSAVKLSRGKQRTIQRQKDKKKRSKHTASVINLSKHTDEVKIKGSTSTTTKRKGSTNDFSAKIKQKIEDFRIIANCLEEYTNEERRNNSEVNISEILKIIGAFNRSEIAPISKPLEKLIQEIVCSIQVALPSQFRERTKLSAVFESPKKSKEQDDQKQIKDTVKKIQASHEIFLKRQECPADVSKLEENLGRLKYQSNRLKYFLEEISSADNSRRKQTDDSSKIQREKLQELQKLKQIADQQQKIIYELEQSSASQNTFQEEQN